MPTAAEALEAGLAHRVWDSQGGEAGGGKGSSTSGSSSSSSSGGGSGGSGSGGSGGEGEELGESEDERVARLVLAEAQAMAESWTPTVASTGRCRGCGKRAASRIDISGSRSDSGSLGDGMGAARAGGEAVEALAALAAYKA